MTSRCEPRRTTTTTTGRPRCLRLIKSVSRLWQTFAEQKCTSRAGVFVGRIQPVCSVDNGVVPWGPQEGGWVEMTGDLTEGVLPPN